GDVREEWTAAGALDELDRRIGEHVGRVSLGADLGAVPQEERALVRVPGRVRGLPDAAPAVDEALLEALVLRPERVVVAEVPLAEDARAVARGGEHLGERPF